MLKFRQAPHNLVLNQEIVVQVQAHNDRGWGLFGTSTNGIHVQSEPEALDIPWRSAITTNKQIGVEWSLLPNTRIGMSPVTSYNLWWDEGSNGEFWYSLIGIDEPVLTQTVFLVTKNILEGQYYKFKIRAKNIWGWGEFSPIVTIRASTFPSAVTPITTSYDEVTGGVKISWAQTKNNGDPITDYKIEIFSYDSLSWNEEPKNCYGSDKLIVSRRECIIPVLELYKSPFKLTFNQFIKVRILAINVIGSGNYGEISQALSDTRLKSTALNMWSPYRGEATSVNQIEVKWNQLLPPDNGNSPVLSYNLVWDANTGDCDKNLIGFEIPYLGLSYIVT